MAIDLSSLSVLLNPLTNTSLDPTQADYLNAMVDVQRRMDDMQRQVTDSSQRQQTQQTFAQSASQRSAMQKDITTRVTSLVARVDQAQKAGAPVPEAITTLVNKFQELNGRLQDAAQNNEPIPEDVKKQLAQTTEQIAAFAKLPPPQELPRARPTPVTDIPTTSAPQQQTPEHAADALQSRIDSVQARLDAYRGARQDVAPRATPDTARARDTETTRTAPDARTLKTPTPKEDAQTLRSTRPQQLPSADRRISGEDAAHAETNATDEHILKGAAAERMEDEVRRPFTRATSPEEAALQNELAHLQAQQSALEEVARVPSDTSLPSNLEFADGTSLQDQISMVKDALIRVGSGHDVAHDMEALNTRMSLLAALKQLEAGHSLAGGVVPGTDGLSETDAAQIDQLWQTLQAGHVGEDPHVQEVLHQYLQDGGDFSKSTPRDLSKAAKVKPSDTKAMLQDVASQFFNVPADSDSLDPDQRRQLAKWGAAAHNHLADQLALGQNEDDAKAAAKKALERQILGSDEGNASVVNELRSLFTEGKDTGAITDEQFETYDDLMSRMGTAYVKDMTNKVMTHPDADKEDVVKALFSEVLGYTEKASGGSAPTQQAAVSVGAEA